MKGGRKQGRRKRRQDTREWAGGLEFDKSQRVVENSENWRKLVAKSSVVPAMNFKVKGLMMIMNSNI